jgi:hypothetical protein
MALIMLCAVTLVTDGRLLQTFGSTEVVRVGQLIPHGESAWTTACR